MAWTFLDWRVAAAACRGGSAPKVQSVKLLPTIPNGRARRRTCRCAWTGSPGRSTARPRRPCARRSSAAGCRPGPACPSSRALAAQLGLRRNAVVAGLRAAGQRRPGEGQPGRPAPLSPPRLPSGRPAGPGMPAVRRTWRPPRGPFALGRTAVRPALLQDRLRRAVRPQPAGARSRAPSATATRAAAARRCARAIAGAPRRHAGACAAIRATYAGHQRHAAGAPAAGSARSCGRARPPGWRTPATRPPAAALEAAGARVVPVPVDGAGL